MSFRTSGFDSRRRYDFPTWLPGVPSLEMVGAGFYIVHIPVLACFIRPGVGALLEESFPTVGSVWIAEYQAWRLGVARQQLSMGSFVFTAVNGHMVSPCWVSYKGISQG